MKANGSLRRFVLVALASVLATLTLQAAFALAATPGHVSTLVGNKGGKRIALDLTDVSSITSSSAYATLVTTPITIPEGQSGIVTANFSAEALCTGSTGWCSVRILLDGNAMGPRSDADYAFAAPGASYAGNAMERVLAAVPSGTHTITVQYAVVSGAASFRLDDWVLDVEYWR